MPEIKSKVKIKPIYEPHEINEAKEALKWAIKNDPDIAARWSRAYKIIGQALARTAFERAAKNKGTGYSTATSA